MANKRKGIPAGVKDLVLEEAEYECAHCGHKDGAALTCHHIIPFKDKGPTDYGNLIALCDSCHGRVEKGEIGTKLIRKLKRMQVIRRVTQLGANALRDAYRFHEIIASPIIVRHLVDWGYLNSHNQEIGMTTPSGLYSITEKGRKLVDLWLK